MGVQSGLLCLEAHALASPPQEMCPGTLELEPAYHFSSFLPGLAPSWPPLRSQGCRAWDPGQLPRFLLMEKPVPAFQVCGAHRSFQGQLSDKKFAWS